MNKTDKAIILYAALVIICTGCSSKTVSITPNGDRQVTTITDASKFTDAQSAAWQGYYEAIKSPPVIATITQVDGTVIAINSQTPPPAPVIRQHENQIVGPVTGLLKTGVQIIGGGWVAREIISELQGVNITNTGSGDVTFDRSDNVAVDTTALDNNSTIQVSSDNPMTNTDNSVEKADPIVVTNTEETTTTTTETIKSDESAAE